MRITYTILLFHLLSSALHGAWGTGGGTCAGNTKTTGTSLSCSVTAQNIEAGNVVVVIASLDNISTTDGNTSDCTSVSDTSGNNWTKAVEYTNGQGAAAAGATVCIFFSKLDNSLNTGGGQITINTTSTGARAIRAVEFTIGAGNVPSVVGTPQQVANDAADPGSLTVGSLANAEHLFIRATGLERANGGTWTVTTNYTSMVCSGTTSGGAATNMDTCGEYRILTDTTSTSDPTGTAVDAASVMVALDEAAPPATTGLGWQGRLGWF